ncbi:DUF4870 domain-containing protein [Bacillus sp. V59.32b]|uniref:DUF4870 domain-containing protein n=1 Tax=Bacillus sp. V59.32b TaxID=1758642 RepID=UPI000E3EDD20|nr:DUF4870 domain-containing protein [Bacillus sp. V59.32b]RFU60415.1 DUF4870 domain-containing protein [Bacillus sp. V59.32b]
MVNQDERLLAALIYIASFFTVFIGPLIIWLIKKGDSAFIDYHGREYLNFLISYTIYGIVASLLMFVLIGFLILPILGVVGVIFTIIAAVKAYDGKEYRIPLIFRIL